MVQATSLLWEKSIDFTFRIIFHCDFMLAWTTLGVVWGKSPKFLLPTPTRNLKILLQKNPKNLGFLHPCKFQKSWNCHYPRKTGFFRINHKISQKIELSPSQKFPIPKKALSLSPSPKNRVFCGWGQLEFF